MTTPLTGCPKKYEAVVESWIQAQQALDRDITRVVVSATTKRKYPQCLSVYHNHPFAEEAALLDYGKQDTINAFYDKYLPWVHSLGFPSEMEIEGVSIPVHWRPEGPSEMGINRIQTLTDELQERADVIFSIWRTVFLCVAPLPSKIPSGVLQRVGYTIHMLMLDLDQKQPALKEEHLIISEFEEDPSPILDLVGFAPRYMKGKNPLLTAILNEVDAFLVAEAEVRQKWLGALKAEYHEKERLARECAESSKDISPHLFTVPGDPDYLRLLSEAGLEFYTEDERIRKLGQAVAGLVEEDFGAFMTLYGKLLKKSKKLT